jgi:uncharacterized protein (DUF697 family)
MTDAEAGAAAIIRHYAILCAEATLLPWWWAASPSTAALQLKMLAEISEAYGVPFDADRAKPMLAALGGGGLSFLIAQHPLGLAFKAWLLAIPVVGLPLRLGTGPAIMATYTWLLGRAFVSHYAAGGTYHDFHVTAIAREAQRAVGMARVQGS